MGVINFCKSYIIKYKSKLYMYIIIGLITSILGMMTSIIGGSFINQLIAINGKKYLLYYCVVFFIISILKIFLSIYSNYLYTIIQTKVSFELNKDVLNHLRKVSMLKLKDIDTVYLSQRVNNDSNHLIIFFLGAISDSIINFIMLICTTIVLIAINYKITIVLFFIILLYICLYNLLNKEIYSKSYIVKEAQSEFFSKLNEQLCNIKFIRIHSANKLFDNRLLVSFKNLFNKLMSYQKTIYLFNSCESLVGTIAQLSIYIIGGIEIFNGNLSIGLFTIIISFFGNMIGTTKYFLQFGKNYQEALVCYKRIVEIFNIELQEEGTIKIDYIENIKIENLSFRYKENYIFDNFQAYFEKGNIYSIVGENGVGKSTLIDLIMGVYINSYQGEIAINGIDIKKIDLLAMKFKNIGITEQEPILISDTLITNISLDNKVDIKKIKKICCEIGLNEYINHADRELDTIINNESSNISGGEKQKIAIVRQLVKDPDVMIFDEPLSALDNNSKEKFIKYIEKIKRNKIIFIISHDRYIDKLNSISMTLSKSGMVINKK